MRNTSKIVFDSAIQAELRLLPSIGVSFYQSDSKKGFNVLIKPEEYQ
jgi:hypothetical protein